MEKKNQHFNYIPGDLYIMENGIQCIVMEVNDLADATKVKALDPDPELARQGWFEEEGEYVIWNLEILRNEN